MAVSSLICSAQYFTEKVSGDSIALVRIACAQIRTSPGHARELASQAVMGTPVRLIDKTDGWYHVETPEGYRGYIIANSLYRLDSASCVKWRQAERVVVAGSETRRIYDAEGDVISDVHPLSILEKIAEDGQMLRVRLPDGRCGRIDKEYTVNLFDRENHEPDIDAMINLGKQLMGVSYLWGGTTTAAMDCSGLVKILYQHEGLIIRRDASEQAVTGLRLDDNYMNYEKGDLVFFKNATTGNIVHVGIYIGNGYYLHCAGMVKINSLDPQSPRYISSNIPAGACRIKGYEDTPGITRISSHPWF